MSPFCSFSSRVKAPGGAAAQRGKASDAAAGGAVGTGRGWLTPGARVGVALRTPWGTVCRANGLLVEVSGEKFIVAVPVTVLEILPSAPKGVLNTPRGTKAELAYVKVTITDLGPPFDAPTMDVPMIGLGSLLKHFY